MRIAKHPFIASLIASLIAALWFLGPALVLRGVPLWTSGAAAGDAAPPPPAEIEYIGAARTSFSSAGPTINYPTAVANDIWLLAFATDSTHNSNGPPPLGWTKLDQLSGTTDTTGSTFWKRATGSEAATEEWTSIFDGTELGVAIIVVYRNCKTTGSPFNAQGTPSASTSSAAQSCPAVNTTLNNCMIVGIIAIDPNSDTTGMTWDSPINERIDYNTTPSGLRSGEGAIYIGDKIQTTAGSVTLTGTFSSADIAARFSYALEPQ